MVVAATSEEFSQDFTAVTTSLYFSGADPSKQGFGGEEGQEWHLPVSPQVVKRDGPLITRTRMDKNCYSSIKGLHMDLLKELLLKVCMNSFTGICDTVLVIIFIPLTVLWI